MYHSTGEAKKGKVICPRLPWELLAGIDLELGSLGSLSLFLLLLNGPHSGLVFGKLSIIMTLFLLGQKKLNHSP